MKYTYEIIMDELNNKTLKRTDENDVVCWIPLNPNNSDYQAYLQSLEVNNDPR